MIRSTLSIEEMACSEFTQIEFKGSRLAYTPCFNLGVYKLISKNGSAVWQRLFAGPKTYALRSLVEKRKSTRTIRRQEFLTEARR